MSDVRRGIGFWGGIAIIVGTVIGGGIFRVPASIAAEIQDPRLILGLWAAFGAITLCGALSLAELASLLPRTGGTYVYLRAAYGDAAAFAFGWLYLLVATPSGMGALAAFFGELLLTLLGLDPKGAAPAVAIATVIALTLANLAGLKWGTAIQTFFTIVKVSALLALIGAAFLFGSPAAPGVPPKSGASNLAAVVAFVMFAYNGWVYIGLVGGEVAEPERRLKRIIVAGTLTVIALYLGANLAYHHVLAPSEMVKRIVAVDLMKRTLGPAAGTAIAACILASVFGALNGVILTKSRVPYALARDGLGFAFLGRCHAGSAVPHVSILVQGAVAVVLILWLRDFESLTRYFVVVEWFALVFAILALFVLRRKMADAPRPFRVPGYPWVPLVFVVATTASIVAIVWSRARQGNWAPLIGLGIALSGLPAYWIWRRFAPRRTIAP